MQQIFEQRQQQTLSPQAIRTIEILQMDMQELAMHVKELSQENPFLELDFTKTEREALQRRETNRTIRVQEHELANDYVRRGGNSEEGNPIEALAVSRDRYQDDSIISNVLQQMPKVSKTVHSAVLFLAHHLSPSGYLETELELLAMSANCSADLLKEALAILQQMEPAGMGARNLQDCLLLQLKRLGKADGIEASIVREHLPLVAKNQYHKIAGILKVPEEKVIRACKVICSLNPKPGNGFSVDYEPEYIVPDIYVSAMDPEGNFTITINQNCIPEIRLSEDYYRMLRNSACDDTVRTYLSSHYQQASWMMFAIQQRNETLRKCAEVLVRRQSAFFAGGDGKVIPMTLAQVADEVGVHLSTVGRAVKNKYLQCPRGIYPLRYFFQTGFAKESGDEKKEGISSDTLKDLIYKIVDEENKEKPLSDQQIADKLSEEGYKVARRTVAKYRTELQIPGTAGRRIHRLK